MQANSIFLKKVWEIVRTPNYGHRRIHSRLMDMGHIISLETVNKLMIRNNMVVLKQKSCNKYNSSSKDADTSYYPNLLERDFTSDIPFTKMVTDITQFNLNGFKVYLSPLINLYDGTSISWKISDTPTTEFVLDMINDVVDKLPSYELYVLYIPIGDASIILMHIKKSYMITGLFNP